MGKSTGGKGVQAKVGEFHAGDMLVMRDSRGDLRRVGAVSVEPDRRDAVLRYKDEAGREHRVHPFDLFHADGRVVRGNTRYHVVPPKGSLVAVKSKTGQPKYRLQRGDEWKRTTDVSHRIVNKDVSEYQRV